MAQTLIVVALVAACVAYVAYQLLRTVRAGTGKAGSCCSKGCGGQEPAPTMPGMHFIASSSLRRKR